MSAVLDTGLNVGPEDIAAVEDAARRCGFLPTTLGARVLRGIRRRDLFIMTHPEFKEGIEARSAALVRAIPVEPPNVERTNLVRMFGTLMYNPVYDTQQPVTEPLEFAGETRRHTNWKMV